MAKKKKSSGGGVKAAETPQTDKTNNPQAFWYGASAEIIGDGSGKGLQPCEVGGHSAWSAADTAMVSFRAPDFLRKAALANPVYLRLVYLDKAAGVLEFRYLPRDLPAKKPKKLPPLRLEGSGEWRWAHWVVSDASFAGGLEGADIRLECVPRMPLVITGLFMGTEYPVPPEAKVDPKVPHGDIIKFTFDQSKVFPGTTREVTVYVPKQYDGSKPACVWVAQDGMPPDDPAVLDNLIAKGDVPVLIEIGIKPGRVLSAEGEGSPPFRSNRSFEYDSLTDDYARLVIEEIFPAVERLKTPDGRALRLSRDGNDCGISGGSSGGICAFNTAWERPASFSRVLSVVGSFDNLRNGDRYPGLIRKTEPQAIRVYLQAGEHDLDWFAGDWWMANLRMDRALEWAGYEHRLVTGDNGHGGLQCAMVFPDALRYLWKDWPAPVGRGSIENRVLRDLLLPGKTWLPVAKGTEVSGTLAVNAQGDVFFSDRADSSIRRIRLNGAISTFAAGSGGPMAVGSDDRLYQIDGAARQIVAYDAKGEKSTIATGIRGNSLAAFSQGRFYVGEQESGGGGSRIWLVGSNGSKKIAGSGDLIAASLAVNPAGTMLLVGDARSLVYSCRIAADGMLHDRQRWIAPETKAVPGSAGVGGMLALERLVLMATPLGVQVADEGGVLNAILPGPGDGAETVALGGPDLAVMHVVSGHKLYRREGRLRGSKPAS